MKVFISHNKADKVSARLLAIALVEQGVDVWFDEWSIKPGDSIAGGIEQGLAGSDVFVLVWSTDASKSNWVGTELRAYLKRRIEDNSLRIIPVMVDYTPLPILVADYKGFSLSSGIKHDQIAFEITGCPSDLEIARRLQTRLLELTDGKASSGDPLPYLVCPNCASSRLRRFEQTDNERDDRYYCIRCEDCQWNDWTEL
nr:toll/interleukin-1 receptor domain-containing protein [Nitrospirota bacterium]